MTDGCQKRLECNISLGCAAALLMLQAVGQAGAAADAAQEEAKKVAAKTPKVGSSHMYL